MSTLLCHTLILRILVDIRILKRLRYGIQCCGSGMFIPDRNFSIQGQKDSGCQIRIRIKNLRIFNTKIVSKLSEIWSVMFIPEPDLDFLPIPDPRVKKANAGDPNPGFCWKKLWIQTQDFDDQKWKLDSFKNQFSWENFLFFTSSFEFHKGLSISSLNLISYRYPRQRTSNTSIMNFCSLPGAMSAFLDPDPNKQ